MSHRFLITGLSLLVACSTGQPNNELVIDTKDGPSSELVAKIENKLSSDPCLSKIEVMRREYRFASRDGKVERGLIDINVQDAGIDGLPSGRFGLPPEKWSVLKVRVPAILRLKGAMDGTEELHSRADHRDVA